MGPANVYSFADGETDPCMGYVGCSYTDGQKVVGGRCGAGLWPSQLWSPLMTTVY